MNIEKGIYLNIQFIIEYEEIIPGSSISICWITIRTFIQEIFT